VVDASEHEINRVERGVRLLRGEEVVLVATGRAGHVAGHVNVVGVRDLLHAHRRLAGLEGAVHHVLLFMFGGSHQVPGLGCGDDDLACQHPSPRNEAFQDGKAGGPVTTEPLSKLHVGSNEHTRQRMTLATRQRRCSSVS